MKKKIAVWYIKNLGRIVLLSIAVIFFTVTINYIPYLNFLFSGEVGFPILFIIWYLLFSPSSKMLVLIGLGTLSIAFFAVLFDLKTMSDYLGSFMYFQLMLIFLNYLKDNQKNKNNLD